MTREVDGLDVGWNAEQEGGEDPESLAPRNDREGRDGGSGDSRRRERKTRITR